MVTRQIETATEIDAAPARIWAILTDFAAMPAWNPFIKEISGKLTTGTRLSVLIAPPGKSSMRFKPTVTMVNPERELRWLGRMIIAGILDGEHYFLLDPIGGGRTRFVQGEKFSGILLPLLAGVLSATEAGFHSMNAALKKQAERKEAGPDARPHRSRASPPNNKLLKENNL